MLDKKRVHRTVGIEGMVCSGCEHKVEEELRKLKGMRSVKADHKKKEINLEYDLSQITLKEIDKKIVSLGYRLPESMFERHRRETMYFREEQQRKDYK